MRENASGVAQPFEDDDEYEDEIKSATETKESRFPLAKDALLENELNHEWTRIRKIPALYHFRMSIREDKDWGIKIYEERARAVDDDQEVTYFFLNDYQEICRYMRTIGYGSKGRAETIEKQVAQELEPESYCSLRTTVRGKQSTQDIALFIYHDLADELSGSGLVVVSFDDGGEVAKQFADAWFEKGNAFMKEGLLKNGPD